MQNKKNSEVMLIGNKNFFVCPITTHIDLKDVSKKLNKKLIINKIKKLIYGFKRNLRKTKNSSYGIKPTQCRTKKKFRRKKLLFHQF